ncbi:XdhC family protein [bacterium]|nr:XdhC family protein [bacterium]
MKGQREVVAASLAAARAGHPGVLVTVVRVEGSAYRRPGARMFLPQDGPAVGLVSGGCLEADLAERAAAVLASNEPRTLLYDMQSPDDLVWGLGLGCNGVVRVLLEPIGRSAVPPRDLAFIAECDRDRREGVVVTVFGSSALTGPAVGDRILVDAQGNVRTKPQADDTILQRWQAEAQAALSSRRSRVVHVAEDNAVVDALVEYLQPAIRLVICGAGLDALPVVEQATALGWTVHVVDHRETNATRERFPGATTVGTVAWNALTPTDVPLDARTAVVVMTHHFLNDAEILTSLAGRAPEFVGLLGPKQRADNLVRELGERNVPIATAFRDCLHGPAGLDVGSETPEEIALSLIAEIQAHFAGRSGGMLRDHTGPLHDWND